MPSILETLAEVAVTLAGFSGLVIALGTRVTADPQIATRVFALLAFSGLAFLVAVLPSALVEYTADAAVVLGIPLFISGVVVFYIAASSAVLLARRRFEATFRTFTLGTNLLSIIAGVALILSALDVVLPRSSGTLVLGVVWQLVIAGLTFAFTVVRIGRRED